MDMNTRQILNLFEQISAIPRCSKQEAGISRWLQDWGCSRGLTTVSDPAGNVVMRIPPTPGFETLPGVVIQSHMDMVCEKLPETDHDFTKDPIRLIYDGDWLKADRTTLGADNGIGMAIALELAADPALRHPPLELLFTVDEETGLTGAQRLSSEMIQGRILINLDSEDEGIFTVGCAGGMDTRIRIPVEREKTATNDCLNGIIRISGLKGGHSGIDIHRQRANAVSLAVRALAACRKHVQIQLISLKGGKAHNAIPRDCQAVLACSRAGSGRLQECIAVFAETIKSEYAATESGLRIVIDFQNDGQPGNCPLTPDATDRVIAFLLALPHGVARRSASDPGVVETSSNLAVAELHNDELVAVTSQRSSVMSLRDALTRRIEAIAFLAGGRVQNGNGYPSWQPNMQSALLARSKVVYQEIFFQPPRIEEIHAGLECGIIGAKFTGMDMISIGPTMECPHSPSEKLFIPSVEKVWRFLAALLESYGK